MIETEDIIQISACANNISSELLEKWQRLIIDSCKPDQGYEHLLLVSLN